jgi:long-chain fatty acid transport protein
MAGQDPTPGAIQQEYGTVSGSMVNTLGGAFSGGMLTSMSWARFDFSDDSDFSGKAKGTGFAGKLGAVYQMSKELSFGFAYHSKTAVSDLEATGATLSMNVSGPATGGNPTTIPVTGTIKVKDFQWPQMLGLGTAYQASNKVLLVFDYKWINWKDVMKNFKMTFTADANQPDPTATAFGLGGQTVDATMFQNWDDQHVFMIGAAYAFTDEFTGRLGLNIANNPIPNKFENPLFPAIVKNHVTLGGGYAFSKASSIDFSFVYAPEVKVTNGQGVTTTHSQMNEQIMYSYRF